MNLGMDDRFLGYMRDTLLSSEAVVLTSNLKCFCGGLDLTTFTQPRSESVAYIGSCARKDG